MARFDVSTPDGLAAARRDFFWNDHAFLRLAFSNAHWIGPDLVRTNQPSPRQLEGWARHGIRTVINLRGARDEGYYWLEKEACDRLGLTLIDAPLDSRDPPSKDRVRRARDLFASIEYPALIHCKSGADRAGLMAVFYRHFRLGEPISVARQELSKRYLHSREGLTGVLDYFVETYIDEVASTGVGFLEWVESDAYDPRAMRTRFRASWWGTLLTERLLKRE
ncbi:tyrosine-protein phosphatase [Brevundimonas sp. AJA228-03]|uniref:fused DSP-PTPase phosphatase/NAD kinase-like protein n=1 Tax=Brevundimonas sp. AJA228-03 TaxID=2752515 RepID=UPI001ADEC4B2|nr:sulfur transferase domain-containing protein [Brevundimonas sp. AJA228-03]QTN18490.1 tyrosine-protein phosphatase [Brevundimonas sp. AJA228-03]